MKIRGGETPPPIPPRLAWRSDSPRSRLISLIRGGETPPPIPPRLAWRSDSPRSRLISLIRGGETPPPIPPRFAFRSDHPRSRPCDGSGALVVAQAQEDGVAELAVAGAF